MMDQSICDWTSARLNNQARLFDKPHYLPKVHRRNPIQPITALDNTMSSIVLTLTEENQTSFPIRDGHQAAENPFIAICHRMRCEFKDSGRVIYPTVDQGRSLRMVEASSLQIVEFNAPTVSTVLFEQPNMPIKRSTALFMSVGTHKLSWMRSMPLHSFVESQILRN